MPPVIILKSTKIAFKIKGQRNVIACRGIITDIPIKSHQFLISSFRVLYSRDSQMTGTDEQAPMKIRPISYLRNNSVLI